MKGKMRKWKFKWNHIVLVAALALLFMQGMQVSAEGQTQKENEITVTQLSDPFQTAENVPVHTFRVEANKGVDFLAIPVRVTGNGVALVDISVASEAGQIQIMDKYEPLPVWGFLIRINRGTETWKKLDLTGAGLHLICFKLDEADMNKQLDVTIKAYQYPDISNTDLRAGTVAVGYGAIAAKEIFYKLQIPSTGDIKVEVDAAEASGVVSLYDRSKQDILAANMILDKENSRIYGVKKGTYYLKVGVNGAFRLKYTFTACKQKKNYKKSKATLLKKGKAAKGCFVAGDRKDHWYKIKLKKSQKLQLTLTPAQKAASGENCHIFLYQKKPFQYIWTVKKGYPYSFREKITGGKYQYRTMKKIPKGEYYLKIFRGNDVDGGYQLKWK